MNKVIFIKDKDTVAHLPFLIKNRRTNVLFPHSAHLRANEAFVRINWIETDGFTEPLSAGLAQSAQSAADEKETAEVTKCLENISRITQADHLHCGC